ETVYAQWVQKYGEEQAHYLMEVMGQWTENYTHGVLIDYDFTRPLELSHQVQDICQRRRWQYERLPGDLSLLERWLKGDWDPASFLIVAPGEKVVPSYDASIIKA